MAGGTSISKIQRLFEPLVRRVATLAARGVVRLVRDTHLLQEIQATLLAGETAERLERFQEYGLTSVPKRPSPDGQAEAIVLHLGGGRDHGVIVAVDDRRHRLKGLAEGEVALYDDLGTKVHLKRGGELLLSAVTVKADAPTIHLDGADVDIDGSSIDLDSSGTIDLEADTSISLTCGSSSIEITPSGITITAPAVDFVTAP